MWQFELDGTAVVTAPMRHTFHGAHPPCLPAAAPVLEAARHIHPRARARYRRRDGKPNVGAALRTCRRPRLFMTRVV